MSHKVSEIHQVYIVTWVFHILKRNDYVFLSAKQTMMGDALTPLKRKMVYIS